jgi:hypothetical protein
VSSLGLGRGAERALLDVRAPQRAQDTERLQQPDDDHDVDDRLDLRIHRHVVVEQPEQNRFQFRITLGEMSSSRIRWTAARLKSVLNTRRPSAFRRCSPMGPPAASYVPTVSSRNGVHSRVHAADAR